MNKSYYLLFIVVAVALGAGYYFGFDHGWEGAVKDDESLMPKDEMMPVLPGDEEGEMMGEEMMKENDMMESGGMMEGTAKEFVVAGSPFKFSVSEIKVKRGDKVRIVFQNNQGMHDWVVDEFNARTKVLQAGQTDTVEFIADKTGTFEYYCSVNGHRQMGMKGNLVVE